MFYFKAELNDLTTDDNELNYEPPRKTPSPRPPTLSGPSDIVGVIQDRIQNYKMAQESAKAAGNTSKARRMDRGLKVDNFKIL